MRRNLGRLPSTIGAALVLLLLGGVIAVRVIGNVLAAIVVRIFVFARLLVILIYVGCADRYRELQSKLEGIAR